MAIMLTGATGFIGRHLVRHLVEAGETDLVLMDAVPNRAAIADVAPKVRLIPGDIRETTSIMDAIRKYRVEGIIHLAAFLGTGGIRNPIPSINVNLVGTNNVFEAARLTGIKRVVYTSSNAIYPERRTLDGPRFDEDDPPGPDATNLVYGACKLFNEHIARYYMEAFGLDPIGIRPTSVFGEGRGQRRGAPGDHFVVAPELATWESRSPCPRPSRCRTGSTFATRPRCTCAPIESRIRRTGCSTCPGSAGRAARSTSTCALSFPRRRSR